MAPDQGTADPAAASSTDRILAGAVAVLGRSGVASLSMRAVATEAGVGLGLINYHFGDKPGLVTATLRRVGDQVIARLATAPGESAEAALRRVLHQAVDGRSLAA